VDRRLGKVAVWAIAAVVSVLAIVAVVATVDVAGDTGPADCRAALDGDTDATVSRARRRFSGGAGKSGGLTAASVPQSIDVQGQATQGVAELKFPFGRSREPMLRHQTFRLPPDLPAAVVRVAAVNQVQSSDSRTTPARGGQLIGQVTRAGPGRLITVAACIDPSHPSEALPGSYTGGLLVGKGERLASLSLEAEIQDDDWWLVMLAAGLGAMAGLFVKLAADQRSRGLPDSVMKNLVSHRTSVAIGAGLVTGIYSYLTIYDSDPTFNAGFADLWRVSAETFAGTLAAKAVTDLTGPATSPDEPSSTPAT
jgi:hypothetical protein